MPKLAEGEWTLVVKQGRALKASKKKAAQMKKKRKWIFVVKHPGRSLKAVKKKAVKKKKDKSKKKKKHKNEKHVRVQSHNG